MTTFYGLYFNLHYTHITHYKNLEGFKKNPFQFNQTCFVKPFGPNALILKNIQSTIPSNVDRIPFFFL